MSKTHKHTDIDEALGLLSDEVREEIARIKEEGADAMKKGDWETAKAVIDFAANLEKFAENVERLNSQWAVIAKQHDVEPEPVKAIVGKSFFGKARKGTITPNKDYYVPLLQALVNLGGRGKTQVVIDEVGKLMEGKFKPKDHELLASEPHMVRWRNKVMWARNSLVNQLGHMRSDSPQGVWSISDAGRKWLETQRGTK